MKSTRQIVSTIAMKQGFNYIEKNPLGNLNNILNWVRKMDFWNDGEHSGGCIAGGRTYMHINANGDVEPCAFIRYSNANIKEISLLEALKSPLFMQYKLNQPFNENHLRPCPLLDNPDKLKEMVHKTNAKSTQFLDEESVDDLTDKCQDASRKWAETADRLKEKSTMKERQAVGM